MLKNRLVMVGSGLLLLAAAYSTLVVPRVHHRIPSGWKLEMASVVQQAAAVPGRAGFPAEDVMSETLREIHLVSETKRPESVRVRDRLMVKDIVTGKVGYDFTANFVVDPHTGRHIDRPHQILVFPRHVKKDEYVMRATYLKGIPLKFLREDDVAGLKTYVFGYNGPIDLTEFYEGVVEGARLDVPEKQVVRCANAMFRYRTWVEPVTGQQVKIEESCLSGTYAYDKASGFQLYPMARFESVTAADNVLDLVDVARGARMWHLLLGRMVPIALTIAAIACLVLAAVRWRRAA